MRRRTHPLLPLLAALGLAGAASLLVLALIGTPAAAGDTAPAQAPSPVSAPLASAPLSPVMVRQQRLRALRRALGEQLFFDPRLSHPVGTSCASCHDPHRAFTGTNGSPLGVAAGAVPGRYGTRSVPSLTYAAYIPPFSGGDDDDPAADPHGGLFLDGRADFFWEQSKGPLLSPLEMNNPDAAAVVATVRQYYAAQMRAAYGDDIFDRPKRAFAAVGVALEAFEHDDPRFQPFSSRFDRWRRGEVTLTALEQRGLTLFMDPQKGNCVICHRGRVEEPKRVLFFTDFGFETLGVPRNRTLPSCADPTSYDLGLGGPLRQLPRHDESLRGAWRTPGLRNVAVKPSFMHNGVFRRLEDVIAFYGSRDTAPERWYPPGEVYDDLPPSCRGYVTTGAPFGGHPGDPPRLDAQDIVAITAFLRTLTDQEWVDRMPPALTAEELTAHPPRLTPATAASP